MNYRVVEKDAKKYIEYVSLETPLSTERDVLDIISACFENNIQYLIIHADVLSEDFFKLKTGLAGMMLQKFVNYHIKAAVVINSEQRITGKFGEMLVEANKGNDFRVFKDTTEAEKWLLI
jgi:PadR family transcriptional regulator, regulatory protein AphA